MVKNPYNRNPLTPKIIFFYFFYPSKFFSNFHSPYSFFDLSPISFDFSDFLSCDDKILILIIRIA